MATSSASVAPISDTDANFRLWGKAISDALLACGLTKASDTGQIDWATVLKPAAGSTAQGYEIWRFSDALQATAPVFIKIEYGSSSGATIPAIWVTVGTGTNGAGTLTGQVGARHNIRVSSSSSTLANIYVSAASNRVSVALWPGLSNAGIFFSLERVRDNTGTETGDIFYVGGSSPTGTMSQYIPQTGAVPAQVAAVLPAQSGATLVYGTSVGTLPVYPLRGQLHPPATNILGYMAADVTALTTFSVTGYGVSRTYLPLGNLNSYGFQSANTNTTPALRYE
jgi:hypothetical protein